jgi:cell division protein FtsA
VVAVSRADGEISADDVRRTINAAESFAARNPNREVLHLIPREFRVDHEGSIKDPVGMHGVRLEVDTLIVECSAALLKNLFKCIQSAGVSVHDYVFAPLAAAESVLSKRQRELGVVILDIGGGTASFGVYEEGMLLDAGVLPLGGGHITNDVAIGFRTAVDVAERIKMHYGSCLPDGLSKRDTIRLAEFMPEETATYSRRELAEMVEARLCDIFELLQKELKRINKKQLLPGGVVMVGGSVLLPGIADLARRELALPVEIGKPRLGVLVDEDISPSFAVSLGLVQWAAGRIRESSPTWEGRFSRVHQSKWLRWLRSLLP